MKSGLANAGWYGRVALNRYAMRFKDSQTISCQSLAIRGILNTSAHRTRATPS